MALHSLALQPHSSQAHLARGLSDQSLLPLCLPSFGTSEAHRRIQHRVGSHTHSLSPPSNQQRQLCLRRDSLCGGEGRFRPGSGRGRLAVVAEATQAPVTAAASVAPFTAAASVAPFTAAASVAPVTAAASVSPLTAAASIAPLREDQQLKAPSSFEYNQVMKRSMANPYEYHHDLGMSYTRIAPHIVLGSQPQGPGDVTRLVEEEGVGAILNLQEDKDVAYWKVDLPAVTRRCQELGVEYHRRPAVDFDPQSLRRRLPGMVGVIARCVAEGKTVYVHCTAGLGRSPAAVIAYLFWFSEPRMNLQRAYDLVTGLRPCGPKWEAIRGATYDLAKNSPYQPAFEALPGFAFNDVSDFERNLIRERALHC